MSKDYYIGLLISVFLILPAVIFSHDYISLYITIICYNAGVFIKTLLFE